MPATVNSRARSAPMRPTVTVVLPTPLAVASDNHSRDCALSKLEPSCTTAARQPRTNLRGLSAGDARQHVMHQLFERPALIPSCKPQRDRLCAVAHQRIQVLGALGGRAGGGPRLDHLGREYRAVVSIE